MFRLGDHRRLTGRLAIAAIALWAHSSPVTRALGLTALVGPVTRADLRTPPYSEWFEGQYARYQPAASTMESLRPRLAGVSVEAYFGTWCGDSRRQIPRLMRLLDDGGFDESRLRLIALSDRPMEFKQAPGRPELSRKVHRTPTIVVLREGAEVGRIVETPRTSLEGDLLAILEGHGLEPKYGAEAYVHGLIVDLPTADAIKAVRAAGPQVERLEGKESLPHYAEQDLLKNGRAREAEAVLDLHLELNPRSVIGHILRAEALASLGLRDEALLALDRALALEPDNDRARNAALRLRAR